MHGLANVYRKVNNYSFIVVWQLTKIAAPNTSFFEKIMENCFIIASYLSLICLIMDSYMRHGWIWWRIQPEWVARWIMQNPVVQIPDEFRHNRSPQFHNFFFRSTACFPDVQCPDQFCISNGWLLQHKNRGGLHFEEEEEAGTKVNFIVNKKILSCIYFVPP